MSHTIRETAGNAAALGYRTRSAKRIRAASRKALLPCPASFETMESRRLMSAGVSLSDGVLTIEAEPSTATQMGVDFSPEHGQLRTWFNGQTQQFPFSSVKSVR